MPTRSIVINPAAGNEPIILGAHIALAINDQLVAQGSKPLNIIIPIVHERQKSILRDELQSRPDTGQILLDEQAGAILSKVLTSQRNFTEHIQVLNDEYEVTQKALNSHFGKDAKHSFTVHDLTGREVSINPRDIVGSLDTGGRVAIDTHNRDFAFPVLTSELIRAAREANICTSSAQLAAVEARARAEDQMYNRRFIPLVNTLSAPALSEDPTIPIRQKFKELLAQPTMSQAGKVIFTPPMKSVPLVAPFDGGIGEGVYAMLSGHGPGVEDTFRATLRAAEDAGLKVYTNPWADPVEGTLPLSPKALSDPRIKTVVSRAGWGTGWQMLNLGKPWLLIPTQQGDDPEIQLNNQVIVQLGIGAVIDPNTFDGYGMKDYISRLSPRILELRDLTTKHFGTSDGIAYIAQKIAKSYLSLI